MTQRRDCSDPFPSLWDWIMNLGNSGEALHQRRGEERAKTMLRPPSGDG